MLCTPNMKTKTTIHAVAISLTLAIVSAMSLPIAFAQSGRTVQPPPTPTPMPPVAPPKLVDAKPKFVIDPNADKHKIIFPTSYEGRIRLKFAEVDRAIQSRYNSFVEHMNEAGAQGYKMMSVVDYGYPVAIVTLDETQHEYAHFKTTSKLFFSKNGFERKYAEMAEQGFRVISHLFVSRSCGSTAFNPDDNIIEDDCEYTDLFLLERVKGNEQAKQYALVSNVPSWGGKPDVEMTTALNEQLAKGFYPTHAFSKYEILLGYDKQPADDDEGSASKPEVQVIRASWRGQSNLEKQVNELAGRGFRLAFVNDGIGVMYRDRETTTPVSYVWLDAKKKDFEKQLAKLQAGGAIYRMMYPDKLGTENKLIFEQRAITDGTRREYKVLKFEFQEAENAAAGKVQIEFAPLSKETLKIMNRLVKEGFTVRDLFATDKVSVLLEREL